MNATDKADLSKPRILRLIAADGLAGQAMLSLTAGPFLVAYALLLGAQRGQIGLLAAIPLFTQLAQIPSVYLVEKLRARRAITVYASSASRAFLLLIALSPTLFPKEIGLTMLLVAFLLHSVFGALGSVSWSSWMRDLIPQGRFGSFLSRRVRLSAAAGAPLTLASGVFLDYWRRFMPGEALEGYSILFVFGFIAGMVSVYFISITPEPRMEASLDRGKMGELLSRPFHDHNFKNLIVFLSFWNFAINLAAPFFTVYLLERLQYDITTVVGLLLLSQITNAAFTEIWGRLSDRFSNKSVLGIVGPLFMMCILAWTFTTLPGRHVLTLPMLIVIHLVMGMSTAGVALSSTNIRLKLAPKGSATAYLATSSLASSVAGGLGAAAGGILVSYFEVRELSLTFGWAEPGAAFIIRTLDFRGMDFLFLLAFVIGIFSLHRLALVREGGEVKEDVVRHELLLEIRRDFRNFSTAYGLRRLTQFHDWPNEKRGKNPDKER